MMGTVEATWAVKKVKPKIVIPMHHNTFPNINTDVEGFKNNIRKMAKVEVFSM